MIYRMFVLLIVASFCLFGQGCTYRAWYEGFQERQRMECHENRGSEEVQKCLDRVNSMTYDEYVQGREASKKQSK